MRFLYIFPHPDDESFGPATAMAAQIRAGHEVYLLTLTKGGATKKRHELGLSEHEMGEVRVEEMKAVSKTLGLDGMQILDFPDSGLAYLDPRLLEVAIHTHIQKIQPDCLISYAPFGVSGFIDHLITHAVVKRVFVEIEKDEAFRTNHLAMFCLSEKQIESTKSKFGLRPSKEEDIKLRLPVTEGDIQQMRKALKCYKTYQDTIEASGVLNIIHEEVCFELFHYHGPALDAFEKLAAKNTQ